MWSLCRILSMFTIKCNITSWFIGTISCAWFLNIIDRTNVFRKTKQKEREKSQDRNVAAIDFTNLAVFPNILILCIYYMCCILCNVFLHCYLWITLYGLHYVNFGSYSKLINIIIFSSLAFVFESSTRQKMVFTDQPSCVSFQIC